MIDIVIEHLESKAKEFGAKNDGEFSNDII